MADDTLVLKLSEDAYQGDAQFTVDVDGKAIGEPSSVQALHANGDVESFTYIGDFGSGPHTVAINFINDAYGGTPDTDRNLYVEGITYNGTDYSGQGQPNTGAGADTDPNAAEVLSNGTVTFANVAEGTPTSSSPYLFADPAPSAPLHWDIADFHAGRGGEVLNLRDFPFANVVFGTYYKAFLFDEIYNDMTDQAGGTLLTVDHSTVFFDNLHRDDFNASNFEYSYSFNGDPGHPPPPTDSSQATLTVRVSEDAWNGDAQFRVLVDGHQMSGLETATASHAAGDVQEFRYPLPQTASGMYFPNGPHTVQVEFINDAYGGTPDTDRNLYVESISWTANPVSSSPTTTTYSGEGQPNTGAGPDTDPNAAEVFSNGTVTFNNVGGSSSPPPPPSGSDTLVVYASGYQSDMTVMVDGHAVIGPNNVFGSSSTGPFPLALETAFTFSGDFGAGPHTVDIHFDGPGSSSGGFSLYGIDFNGQHYNVDAAENDVPGGSTDPRAAGGSNDGDIIFRNVVEGTPTPDVTVNSRIDVYGGPGDDLLQAEANDYGGAGRDTFVVDHALENPVLHFQPGAGGDIADLVGFGFTSFADVQAHMTATSFGTQLTAPDGRFIDFFADDSIPGSTPTTPTPDTFTADNFILDGTTSSVADELVLHVSEDAWNGNAEFAVRVDGKQVGIIQTTAIAHDQGPPDNIVLVGHFGTGPHTVAIQFLNDAWGGTPDTDRNLYVEGITFNGVNYPGEGQPNTGAGPDTDPNAAEVYSNGTVTFSNVGGSSPPPPPSGATSTIVLHVSEDAYQGDAQFNVRVDGAAQPATFTAHASHAAGAVDDITITGDFGTQGPGTIDVQFLNDAWGGTPQTDRNLYVQSIDVNGVHFAGNTADNDAANGHQADDPSAAVMDIDGTATFHINHTAPPLMG